MIREENITSEVDLLVVGGGMAGLTAAARAALSGARVLLVERGPALGGSGIYAGFIWTAPTHEVMAEVNPDGDPELRAALVDGFAAAVEWIRSLGVEFRDAVTVLRYGRGHQFDTGSTSACVSGSSGTGARCSPRRTPPSCCARARP